jgi:hypothetical protein
MSRVKRISVLLLLTVVFGFGIYCGLRLGPWLGPWLGVKGGPRYNTPVLLKQVQSLSQLVTVQYVLERTIVWDDPPTSLLSFLGETSYNHVLLLAHGIVKAGVDLSRLGPDDLRVNGTTVIIVLPPAMITDAYLDDSQTKVIERKTGFLRSFDKDLEQTVRQNAVDDLRRAARNGGILSDAEARARTQLANLFLQLGFEKVEYRSSQGLPPEQINLSPGVNVEKPAQ